MTIEDVIDDQMRREGWQFPLSEWGQQVKANRVALAKEILEKVTR